MEPQYCLAEIWLTVADFVRSAGGTAIARAAPAA